MRCTTSLRNNILPVIALLLFACATDPYQTISVGDSREQVIALLGKPGSIDKDLPPSRKVFITSTLRKLDNKDSETFSIWKPDGDLVYVVGFNKKGQVAVKHRFFFTKAYLKNSAVYEQGLLLTLGGHFSRSNRR